jgi:Ca2+-binding RTX toxin-like protein
MLDGGTGNDTYVVDATGDVVTELVSGGLDTVRTSLLWYRLGAHVENLTLTGEAISIGVGNGLGNTMVGDAGVNVLSGGAGDDMLRGGAGSDLLDGGTGADTLQGGTGDDALDGGTGNDRYEFSRGDGRDVIRDRDTVAGNQDRLAFGMMINPLDLILERQANDLRLRVYGSGDQVLIGSWYGTGTVNHLETIQAGNGRMLLNTQVDQLIQAMAGFTQQTGLSWDAAAGGAGTVPQQAQFQGILAANWQ